jgi:hypothetical protein
MRIMNLPKLPAGPNSPDECVKTYLQRLPAGEALWPHVSTLLTAYMSWPNDEQRRDASHVPQIRFACSREAAKGRWPSPRPSGPGLAALRTHQRHRLLLCRVNGDRGLPFPIFVFVSALSDMGISL